jgi:hypothetical protein
MAMAVLLADLSSRFGNFRRFKELYGPSTSSGGGEPAPQEISPQVADPGEPPETAAIFALAQAMGAREQISN